MTIGAAGQIASSPVLRAPSPPSDGGEGRERFHEPPRLAICSLERPQRAAGLPPAEAWPWPLAGECAARLRTRAPPSQFQTGSTFLGRRSFDGFHRLSSGNGITRRDSISKCAAWLLRAGRCGRASSGPRPGPAASSFGRWIPGGCCADDHRSWFRPRPPLLWDRSK